MRTVVGWAPREFNKARRMHVSAQSLSWNVLPEALDAGREAERAFQKMKETDGLPNKCRKQAKRKVETRLKMTDPW